jgi:hypothetical protein
MLEEVLMEFMCNIHYGVDLWMPCLKYTAIAWLLRIVVIVVACMFWYFSIKGFRKQRWMMPGLANSFAFVLVFIASFEIDIVIHQCEDAGCLYVHHETYYGILGIRLYKTDEHIGQCACKDSSKILLKTAEVRLWGGVIGFLPFRTRNLHKFSGYCPYCGSTIGRQQYTFSSESKESSGVCTCTVPSNNMKTTQSESKSDNPEDTYEPQ